MPVILAGHCKAVPPPQTENHRNLDSGQQTTLPLTCLLSPVKDSLGIKLIAGADGVTLFGLSLSGYEERLRRCALLTALYAAPAWLAFAPANSVDLDIWWHLRTGQWIWEHRWVPYADWFSSYGMGKPWAAYSWLFEILIYGLFSRLGLVGFFVYVYVLLVSITAALHSLIRKFEPRVAQSVALTAAALFAIVSLRTPRPWLFTILFFIIELNLLVKVRRTRDYRVLWLLPPLFALWANLHIQFIYGLFVLGLAALEDSCRRLLSRRGAVDEETDRPLPTRLMVVITIACVLATLVNPYHFRIYAVVFDTVRQAGLYYLITELQAMSFRAFPDWIVLGLTLGAAFVLGRARRIDPFWALLLLAGVYLSFRSGRDVWFVTIVASVIIARARSPLAIESGYQMSKAQVLLVVLLTVALSSLAIQSYRLSNVQIQKAVAESLPAAAANFIEEQGFSGPLYNHFDWGGYLIWRLPKLTVSIDGRSNVHDAERIRHTLKIWKGEPDWASDLELAAAHIVIAQKNLPLTQLLRLDSRFEIVYEDEVAVVFIAREGSAKQ